MTEPMIAPRRRRRWLLVLPFALIVLLALGWSAFWYQAAQLTERTVATWIEREAKLGRHYACASRSVGGYPFRIELRCGEVAADLVLGDTAIALKGGELRAVAQVWQPNHIIAEVSGPVTVAEGGRPSAILHWQLAQGSLRGLSGAPERLSIVLTEPRLERPGNNGNDVVLAATRTEFHVRLSPVSEQANPVFDVAVRLAGAKAPVGGQFGQRPVDAEFTAVLRGLKDLAPKPLPVRLKEWQETGGKLEVASLSVRQGTAVAVAKGALGLSAAGRIDGLINITMAGFEAVIQDAVAATTGMKVRDGLVTGLSLLGRPAELDGKKATTIPLRFRDGAVSLGPVPLGKTAPLY